MLPASVWKQTEQSPQPTEETLTSLVKRHMDANHMRAAELAYKSGLSKATVSRILSNKASRRKNGETVPYRASDRVVTAIAIGLGLDKSGWERLMDAAFPERRVWFEALDNHLNIMAANMRLDEEGLPTLGDP